MAERRATIIRTLTFAEADRSSLVLSDPTKIRVDSFIDAVTLKLLADGTYPTTAGLYVISTVVNPGKFRALVGFQASIRHYKINNAQVTSEGYRLFDGTNQYWWSGTAWAINTTNWNTEAEVANNIAAFSALALASKKFAAVVNLGTTSNTITPQLVQIKFGFEVKQHSWVDDIFIRSLTRDMAAVIRPIADLAAVSDGTTAVNVSAAVSACGVPFKFQDVDSIFNVDTDPNLEVNLLSSFNPGTGIATLTGAPSASANLRIQFTYLPQLAVFTTSPDYVEVESLPLIVIENIRTGSSRRGQSAESIVNKSSAAALEVSAPWTADLEFDLRAICPGSVDLLRVVEAIMDFADQFPTIRSDATDFEYRLQLTDEFDSHVSPQASGVCEATASFKLHDVCIVKHGAVGKVAIKRIVATIQTGLQTSPSTGFTVDSTTGNPPLGNTPQQ